MPRSARRCLALLLGLSPLVSGCVDQVDRSEAAAPDTAVDGSEREAGLAFEDAPDQPDDELILGLVRPEAVDPSVVSLSDQGAVIVADLLYDGLTEAVGTSGRLRPALATDWEAGDDGISWTFTIDTDRISPDAVVAHLDRLRTGADNPAVATLLAEVTVIQVVGDDQVRFELAKPDLGFPWLVSGVALSIPGEGGAPTGGHELFGGGLMAPVPVDDPDPMVTITSSDELHLRSVAGDRPDVAIRWYHTDRDAYTALTLGQVDAAVAPPDALSDAASRYGQAPQARGIARFYGLNIDNGPLADERLRAAVLAGLDRTELAEDAFPVPVLAADGVVAPTTAGYHLGGCGDTCSHDVLSARDLVAAVTTEDGAVPELTIAVTGPEQRVTAERVADGLEHVGFKVWVEQQEPADLARTIAEGQADLFAFGWVAGAGSLDAVVPQLFASDSQANAVGVESPEVDDLISRARTTADDLERWELLAQAHETALGQGRVLPLAVAVSNLVTNPQTSGLVERADGSVDLARK